MNEKLQLVSTVLENCSQSHLDSVFAPMADLPNSSTKAEVISHCLNTELGAYGFKSYTSPDKTAVLINDEGMCKVLDFFRDKNYQPVLTDQHIERVGKVIEFADKGKINILWDQAGFKKKYYYFKQYGFNGINLINVLNINSINSAAIAVSPVGAAGLTMGGVVALSWTGSLFFSTLENYIPNTMPRMKLVVSGVKFGTALPIRCVEWTANSIFGFVEDLILGYTLPTNTTEMYKLDVGPKLKNIAKVKKPIIAWLIKRLNNF